MSVARTREYAQLAAAGDGTSDERRHLLETHEADIVDRIAELEQSLAVVRAKLDFYAGRVSSPAEVFRLVEEARRNGAGRPASTDA